MKIPFYPKPFKSSSNCTKCFTVKVRLFKTTWELNEKLFHTLSTVNERKVFLSKRKNLSPKGTQLFLFVGKSIIHDFTFNKVYQTFFVFSKESHKIKLTTTQTWISIEKRHHFESLVHLIANHRWNSYTLKLFN